MSNALTGLFIDVFKGIFDFFMRIFSALLNWFMELIIWERLIIINFVTAFFAVLLPVAKFYILDFWYGISNPLAINLIGLVFVMFATVFFPFFLTMLVRVTLNVLYIVHLLIIVLSGSLTHAPEYNYSIGMLLNFFAPLAFIILSLLSYRDRK